MITEEKYIGHNVIIFGQNQKVSMKWEKTSSYLQYRMMGNIVLEHTKGELQLNSRSS